jgi:hypothetical protein
MFNRISKWLEEHRGLLAVIAMILAIYLHWSDDINNAVSHALNISSKRLTTLLKQNLRIDRFIFLLLLFYIFKYVWKYIRIKEITIIKATYYTPQQSVEITDKIKLIVEKNRTSRFQITNELAGGDPQYGQPKKLDLVYKIGRSKINKTFGEGEWISLI